MIGMAGRRLRAAGIVVAAIAATITFCLPAPRAAVVAPAIRLSTAAIAQVRTQIRAQVSAPDAPLTTLTSALPQPQTAATAGVAAVLTALVVIVLVGAVPPPRRPVPVRVSRLSRRDRAPPSPGC
jgi:hypothetical protein